MIITSYYHITIVNHCDTIITLSILLHITRIKEYRSTSLLEQSRMVVCVLILFNTCPGAVFHCCYMPCRTVTGKIYTYIKLKSHPSVCLSCIPWHPTSILPITARVSAVLTSKKVLIILELYRFKMEFPTAVICRLQHIECKGVT